MRVCRFLEGDRIAAGFYFDDFVVDCDRALESEGHAIAQPISARLEETLELLPHGRLYEEAQTTWERLASEPDLRRRLGQATEETELLCPFPLPRKLLLLAGNYPEHVVEAGDIARERERTFPYVFLKPASTTLNHPGADIAIPRISPDHIDWEVELAVVIGRAGKAIPEAQALDHVAGYTILNDISDRRFRPNPSREERGRDRFFDWLHGKWHDGFAPAGPCILASTACRDPQALDLELRVNGAVKQRGLTSEQVFPVAAVIEFISSFVTLERGDVISTGTPSGVGKARGEHLRPGDEIEASIGGIGTLRNRVVLGE
ncbi:MAG TPA: fumarylacetoacetate hydrolase family protein [Planctomycetota bacterium]|nr:fumarylacetoacetate hydrolase family protein [Planctomycetota bacterium]